MRAATGSGPGLEGQSFSDNSTSGNFLDDASSGTPAELTWQGTLDAAALASGDGWRLPNVAELKTIAEDSCYDPAANLGVVPNMGNYYLWSSSPTADDADTAWFRDVSAGSADSNTRNGSNQVRLVRGGQ